MTRWSPVGENRGYCEPPQGTVVNPTQVLGATTRTSDPSTADAVTTELKKVPGAVQLRANRFVADQSAT